MNQTLFLYHKGKLPPKFFDYTEFYYVAATPNIVRTFDANRAYASEVWAFDLSPDLGYAYLIYAKKSASWHTPLLITRVTGRRMAQETCTALKRLRDVAVKLSS